MNRDLLRRVGIWFIVLGAALIFLGLYGLNTTMVNCPGNGCSSAEWWSVFGPYEIAVWSGVALVVLGVVMLIWSFVMPAEAISKAI